jgi:hypothetical protein
MTVTFTVTDNADNEDGRRLQRSRDDGATWTTVDDAGPDVTTLKDPNPPLYEPVNYRTQVYTEHVVSNSDSVTVTPVRGKKVYVELGPSGSPTIIEPGNIVSASISPEHTAIWGADLTVAPADRGALDVALDELRLYYGSARLFDGECRIASRSQGQATLRGYGKTNRLREDTAIVTYPDAISSPGGVPIDDAITDYWGRTGASATVYTPSTNTVRTGEPFYDLPTAQQFSTVFDIPDDVPVTASTTQLDLEQTCWFQEAENAASIVGSVVDSAFTNGDLSNGEGVELTAAGQSVELTATPTHDFPSDEFRPRVRIGTENFYGDIYIIVDGQRVWHFPRGDAGTNTTVSDSMDWRGSLQFGANTTTDSIPDFSGGQSYDFGVELDSNTTGGVTGRCIVDCLAPRDAGDRFGGWTYNEDNSPNTNEASQLTGPELYPDGADVSVTADEVWHVPSATLTVSMNDTTHDQALGLSPDGSNFATASNTTSLTADFDAQDWYGTNAIARVTLSRYDSGQITDSPTQGDVGQTVTDLLLEVDTDDLPLLTADNPLTLDANTHLKNLQTLHETGTFRFVVDHQADGLVVESFRKGDPVVEKTLDVTLYANGDEEERDTKDYANKLIAYGDGTDATLIQADEIDRVGKEVVNSITRPSVTDSLELSDIARKELIGRTRNDEYSGRLEIAPQLVLPGYPYTVPPFGDRTANLNGVRLEFGANSARGELQFGKARTLARRISELETD